VASCYGPHICGDSLDIRDGNILAGSYADEENLYLIDMKKMETIRKIEWFGEEFERTELIKPSALYAAMFTTDGKYILAGGTGRNEVRIFKNNDPSDGYKVVSSIADLNHACLTLDVVHEGYGFAFGCADGYLRIMSMSETTTE